MRYKIILLLGAFMAFSAAISKAAVDTVQVVDFSFIPASLTLTPGDTVVWKVTQECCIAHTVTRTLSPAWNSGPLLLGETFQLVFPECGTYSYFCSPHQGLGMVGTIKVVQPGAAAKGDMNASGGLSPADAVLMLNCVFLGTGNCGMCVADVNCDGVLTPSDVVLELNAIFLAMPFPC